MGQCHSKTSKKKNKNKSKNKSIPRFDSREEYFIKNGGILLEKQIALSRGQDIGSGQLKIFSKEDIERATNCYDPDQILGSMQSTVYKGTLDDRVVAVKTPKDLQLNQTLVDFFFTEAATGMVMSHDNMVKLYGCCLETFIPIIVYEFQPNGSLFQQLHTSSKRLQWTDRLRVATDTGYALSYMHNALSKPVVHRDLNSISILLDHSYRGKLANFGYSVAITPGDTSQRWPVIGTPGYIDPEYVETEEVTDKCDVYSFGVLLLEVLTGMQPFKMARGGMDLVDVFVSAVGKKCMIEMIDSEVSEQASNAEIQRVAQLALACVAKKGVERPSMIDTVNELWSMQDR